jgi:aminoglycoside phosphotransferase (APT) family kinase protein
VEYEAKIAHAVFDSGVPSPAPGEIIDVNGRCGLIYERLEGISMLQDMNARPWMLFNYARSLAELQVQIHQCSIPGLPTYKERLNDDIRNTDQLSEDLRMKAFALLEALPEGKSLCHGDYHPGNVLITNRGPVVIDWMTACTGSPWADVARSSLLLSIGANAAGKQVRSIVRLVVRLYHYSYLNQYRRMIPDAGNELHRWSPVIAAARLSEDIIPEREALIKVVQKGVKE